MTQQRIIAVDTPTPCAVPDNRDLFADLIDLTYSKRHSRGAANADSRMFLRLAEEAKAVCGGCPERNQCLDVHGRDYTLGVIAGATDAKRADHFGEAIA